MTAQQLKNSILQMAVQGKLVPQNPDDEPASVLLERIKAEKDKLVAEKKIKKEKPLAPITEDEIPFEIPESWEWCRLSLLTSKEIKRGKSPKYVESSNVFVFAQKCNVKRGGIDITLAKCLDMSTFDKYPEEEYLINNDIIVNSTGNGTLGRIGVFHDSDRINTNIIVPDSHITVIRALNSIESKYIYYILKYYQPFLESLGEGSTNQTELKPVILADLIVSLPALTEQKRIVAKIEELLPYIDAYEKAETQLKDLNISFPEMLKKSILQEAVQGKLVPQNPDDEPASVLLERIKAEKQELIKQGKIKKEKPSAPITEEEIPFEIPESWEWCRLGDLCYMFGGYAYKSNEFLEKSQYQVLRLGNVKNDYIKYDTKPVFISSELAEKTSSFKCLPNDILVTMTGTRKKRDYFFTVRIDEKDTDIYVNQRVGCIRCYHNNISYWLTKILKTEFVLNQVFVYETGTANQGNLGNEAILKTMVPLPPLSEQKRIVEKIEELMPMIESLS